MTRKLWAIFAATLIMGLAACATPVQHATPSGKAEVTITGTSRSAVKNQITDKMMNKGYSVVKSDDTVISFDRPVDNPMATMFFGSRYDSTPNARVTYNLIQTGNAVRVVADCLIVTNPGSGFEQKTNANNNQGTVNVQGWLNEIKRDLQRKRK